MEPILERILEKVDEMSEKVDDISEKVEPMERVLGRLEILESVVSKLIDSNSKKEEEEPEFRFVCKPCRYRTNHSGDWRKHLTRAKHIRMVAQKEAQKEEEEKKADVFYKVRQKYPEMADERDLDILTAYAWLRPLQREDGKQSMCCQPLKNLWAAVHQYQFGGNYFMRASKRMLYNKVLPRNEYTFDVFDKMVNAANGVLSEAKYLIEERDRHEKYQHNIQNWQEFDLATAQALPVFRNDKSSGQKSLKSLSLHEYLMSCG